MEGFEVSTPDRIIRSALFNGLDYDSITDKEHRGIGKSPRGELFTLEVADKVIHITFTPKGMEVLREPCRIWWINAYRR